MVWSSVEDVDRGANRLVVVELQGGLEFADSVGDGLDLGLLAAALFACADVQDAVGVDEKLDLDARQPGSHGRDAFEVKTS